MPDDAIVVSGASQLLFIPAGNAAAAAAAALRTSDWVLVHLREELVEREGHKRGKQTGGASIAVSLLLRYVVNPQARLVPSARHDFGRI